MYSQDRKAIKITAIYKRDLKLSKNVKQLVLSLYQINKVGCHTENAGLKNVR